MRFFLCLIFLSSRGLLSFGVSCHSRVGGNPSWVRLERWIPAYAGMTEDHSKKTGHDTNSCLLDN